MCSVFSVLCSERGTEMCSVFSVLCSERGTEMCSVFSVLFSGRGTEMCSVFSVLCSDRKGNGYPRRDAPNGEFLYTVTHHSAEFE